MAIGRGGQNVRLAVKLTSWKIDIVGSESGVVPTETTGEATPELAVGDVPPGEAVEPEVAAAAEVIPEPPVDVPSETTPTE